MTNETDTTTAAAIATRSAVSRRARHRRDVIHDDRRLVLADVENLLGCEPRHANSALFELAIEALLDRIGYRVGVDQLVIGAGPLSAVKVFGVRVPHRLVVRRGPSGADRALVDAIADHCHVAARYDEVVVASGDHEFTSTVAGCSAHGLRTTVVGRGGSISRELAGVADEVVEVPSAQHLVGLAA